MPDYTIEWRIELAAETPVDAARQALEIMRDPASTSTVFTVLDDEGETHEIDLEEDYETTSD